MARLFSFLCLALLAVNVLAHELSPAYLGFEEQEADRFTVRWKASIVGGLASVLAPKLPQNCSQSGSARSADIEGARIAQATFICAGGLAGQQIAVEGLSQTRTDVLVHIKYMQGADYTGRLTPDNAELQIPAQQAIGEVFVDYLWLGVEHILIGTDHLLFVLALLLLVKGLRPLIITVTAFTLAHSLTLAAATLGWVNVPSQPVESVIALSILFLATELARDKTGSHQDIGQRFPWIVAFAFGLLHGFGFAGVLSDLGLPADAIPLALVAFNLGVEFGQLIFIAVVLSLAAAVSWLRVPVPAMWRKVLVYLIGSFAALWFIERTAGWI